MNHGAATLASTPYGSSPGERRRHIRHKLHSPIYASFNGPWAGLVVDLSELRDLSEDGFCVQTSLSPPPFADADSFDSNRIEVNHPVTLSLDLPETKSYVHGTGWVVWRDDAARVGIRFASLAERGPEALREWLFVNLLVACANYEARSAQLARRVEEPPIGESFPLAGAQSVSQLADEQPSDRAQLLSALDGVRSEVRELESSGIETGEDPTEVICQLITDRAMMLTGATGAALALLTDGRMLCRALSGAAPAVGSEVDIDGGLSGECVRTGEIVRCEDTAVDWRVDPEVCQSLGLGAILAAPVLVDTRVVGLLDVFFPNARAFSNDEPTVIERLAELAPWSDSDVASAGNSTTFNPTIMAQTESPLVAHDMGVPADAFSAEESEIAEPEIAEPEIAESAIPESAITDSAIAEPSIALDHLRVALWDRAPDLEQEMVADHEKEIALERSQSAIPPPQSNVAHLSLILSSVAAVALAMGYLLAPVIERHLDRVHPAANSSSSYAPQPGTVRTGGVTAADLQKSAGQGDPEAQFMLGTMYRNGDGVAQDDKRAVEWFQRAANQGYVRALSALGSSYWAGRGVPQDYLQAYFWYELALAEGDENSKALLEGLSTQLTQTQVSSARQQAEAWLQAHNQLSKSSPN
jgi:GAF domain-containing protein